MLVFGGFESTVWVGTPVFILPFYTNSLDESQRTDKQKHISSEWRVAPADTGSSGQTDTRDDHQQEANGNDAWV